MKIDRTKIEKVAPKSGDIAATVQEQFLISDRIGLRSLSCKQLADILMLYGEVSSYHYKQLAQEIAMKLAGPLTILNKVEVAAPEGGSTEKTK